MDRRAKKLEKKRKTRDLAKKRAQAVAARRPSDKERLVNQAARSEFGPCFASAGWDELSTPELVSIVVTRKLANGLLLPAVVLVDRSCLGVKDAFVAEPILPGDLADFVEDAARAHEGMLPCEPIVAQSIAFHAIDFARKLGFEPHRDFPAAMFEPRPPELLSTPWHAPERPVYIAGPRDDARTIVTRLAAAVGAGNFDYEAPLGRLSSNVDEDDDDFEDDELIYSPLQRSVTRGDRTVRICIYRGSSEDGWLLEVEDHNGGSTVWQERFATDQAALDDAMRSIDEEGIESFVVPTTATAP